MKRVGVFLGYAPEQPLRNQGIGRLLGALLKQWSSDTGTAVLVACPLWYRPAVVELMKEYRIPRGSIEFLTTPSIPAVVKLKKSWDLWRRRERKPHRILDWARAWIGRGFRQVATSVFASATLWSFFLRIVVLLPLAVVLAPVFLLVVTARFCARVARRSTAIAFRRFSWASRLLALANSPLPTLNRSALANFVYGAARDAELKRLVARINERHDVDVWYVPGMFWPEIRSIRAPTVVAAPDIVHADFPTRFAEDYQLAALRRVMECASEATHLVCYSQHVLERQLIGSFNVDRQRCSVIQHGYGGMSGLLDIDPDKASPEAMRHYCCGVLRDYQRHYLWGRQYLADFDFPSARFFFYSSQVRPHKNHLALLKAFEFLLRRRYVNAKLVLTGDIASDPEATAFVQSRRLTYDVLILHDVPNDVLIALNCLATLAVNPSLFEGGFPFTFAEAFSVGTPSVMAAIPATLELVQDPTLRAHMLFNPYSVDDVAEKMEYAFRNREALHALQAPLYDALARRTWAIAAAEYLELFKAVAERPRLPAGVSAAA
jgi:glycosyltransferase involved in cell wall biosynthesis